MAGNQGALRQANRKRILYLLRTQGPLSQADLARQAGLSRSTVSTIVAGLQREGTVRSASQADTTEGRRPGRPSSLVSLDPTVGAVVGVDIDHERLTVLVADAAHRVLAEDRRPLERDHEAAEVMRLTAQLVEQTIRTAGVLKDRVAGVGVGLAGPIDLATGRVYPSSIAPSWHDVDPRNDLGDLLGLPVHIDNDANLGALAELMWGSGRGCTELAYVKLDTGVGVGLVVEGRIHRGAGGTAGEIGHSTIDENGPVCRCGNRGCLEGFVGTPALVESLRGRYASDITIDDILRLAAEGDVGCRRVVADAGRLLGIQVANLCNLLNPRRVIIAGRLASAGDVLLDPLRTAVTRRALPHAVETVEVVPATLGDRATALGAAALVLHETAAIASEIDPLGVPPNEVRSAPAPEGRMAGARR